MVIKLKKKVNATSVDNYVLELFKIKDMKKELEKREEELKDKITPFVLSTVTPDSKKDYYYFVSSPAGQEIIYQRQARKKVVLNNDRAIELLQKNDLEDYITEELVIAEEVTQEQLIEALEQAGYNSYLEIRETVKEEALEELIVNEKITEEELESVCDINITYATLCYEKKG